jgi:polysaccharide biosynthesis transport protein
MPSRPTTVPKFKLKPLSIFRIFWKRKVSLALIWAAVAIAGTAFVYKLPNVYQAQAVILVESQRIPEKFVSTTVNEDLKNRLSSLSQQILSSNRLLELIQRFDLYKEERSSHAQEEIIEMMRADVSAQVQTNWAKKADATPNAFSVSYEGPNPTVVALVANQLATFFIDENIQAREVQATGTSEFLGSQLDTAKLRLEEQEKRLSDFKMKNNGELPEQENALIASASQLQTRLQGINDAIERAKQTRIMQESALASAQASQAAMTQLVEQLNSPAPLPSDPSGEPLKTSERLQRQLEQMLLTYNDDYPQVKALRGLIPQVQKEEEKGEKAAKLGGQRSAAGGSTNGSSEQSSAALITAFPKFRNERSLQAAEVLLRNREQVENIKAQQAAAAKEIESLDAERKSIVQRIDAIQKAIGKLPIREQELSSIVRDYDTSKANYQSLLDKKLAAEMSTDMERRQKAERFIVIDQARTPEKPVKPNRPLLAAVSALSGLLLGLVFALGKEMRTNAILGEWELPRGVPVLGRIPRISPAADAAPSDAPKRRTVRIRFALIGSSVVLLLAVAAAAAGFYLGKFGK